MILVLFITSANVYAADKVIKYGTYNDRTFYYTMSASKSVRISKSSKTLSNTEFALEWIHGAEKIAIGFADYYVSIPFSVISGIEGINPNKVTITESCESYFVFLGDYQTRTIFAYTNKDKTSKRVVLKDEKGTFDVFYQFEPVGKGWSKSSYSTPIATDVSLNTQNYYKKTSNLKTCNTNYNHKGKTVWTLSSEVLTESWKSN